ncbi:MAG: 4-hydroxy-tetrahydrodipicolinate reductase [Lysobacterales bacterium]
MPLPIVVHGASGRMGRAVLGALAERADVRAVAALVRLGSALDGQAIACAPDARASGLAHASALPDGIAACALIDFSSAAAFDGALGLAVRRRIAFVSGTTGLDSAQRAALDRAASTIPVLWSANFSLGVALLSQLVAEAARALPDWDCEIAEAHHSRKQDAPSGTALALAREVAAARDQDFDAVAELRRNTPRAAGSIGFAVTRAGDIVGEHRVLFATAGERVELIHRATDRMIFARGAVAAACWLAGRPPGRHALADVLRT